MRTSPALRVSNVLITSDSGADAPVLHLDANEDGRVNTDHRLPSETMVHYGDDQDDDGVPTTYLGNAARIRWVSATALEIRTSLTGFPPLYCHRSPAGVVIAPRVHAIAGVRGALVADLHGMAEWIRIGVPILHRTLFAEVSLLPAGVTLQLRGNGDLHQVGAWAPDHQPLFPDSESYLDAQVRALDAAMQRMDTSRSFLSLTAGLDTRAVLSMLVRAGRRLPAVTISGVRDSLDARVARRLCAALGWPHHVVRPDTTYFNDIETLTRCAVRLSGGLAGIEQALEVYTYRPGHGARDARLTGNIGNQIGRSGTEGVGMRGLSPRWFRQEVGAAVARLPSTHWHAQITRGPTMEATDLVQRESLFASLGNATLGAALALQQTPYADRTIISNKLREPRVASDPRGARTRDLAHRFVGEPATRSFQRRAIIEVGGAAARIPINWGAVPTGGVSLPAAIRGLGAGLDALLAKESGAHSYLRPLRSMLAVRGLSGFRSEPVWRNAHAAAFILDTLRDAVATDHPFLDRQAVRQLIDQRRPSDMTVAMQLLTLELVRQEYGINRFAPGTASASGPWR